jgi:hypothetical protein
MSEQWLGLHHHDRHFVTFEGGACHCDECDVSLCLPNRLCRCCLAAEVEALRAREAQSLDVNALLSELAELRARLSTESVAQLVQQSNVVALDVLIEVMQESRGKFTTYDQAFGLVCAIRNAVAASGTALAGEIAVALDGDDE